MPIGYFSLVLHAHLPFVRHPEHPEFLEEDWLYEAITEVYLPLIYVFSNLYEMGARVMRSLYHSLQRTWGTTSLMNRSMVARLREGSPRLKSGMMSSSTPASR